MKKTLLVSIILVVSSLNSFCQNKGGVYFLESLNKLRVENGLNPVVFSPILDSACKFHTVWMLENKELDHGEYTYRNDGKKYSLVDDRVKKYDYLKYFPPMYEDSSFKDKDGWIKTYYKSNNLENVGYYFVMNTKFSEKTVLEMDSLTRIMFINWVNSDGHKKTLLMKKATHVGYYVGYIYVPEKFSFYTYATCILSRKEN